MPALRPETIFWVYVLTAAVTVIFAATVIGVIVVAQRRQVEQSRRFSQGMVEAQEAERSRIARELHDDVIQRVALIGGELSALGRAIPGPTPAVTQRIDGLREELNDLADEVRSMARRAHPAILDHLGLVQALRGLAVDMKVSDDLSVEVYADSNLVLDRVGAAASLALYRIAQEGLRNVTRHAGVRAAVVRLTSQGDGIVLEIEDKGRGMNVTEGVGAGLGLLGMSERLRAVQGELSIVSRPGRGTRIIAWVLEREAA